jgi:hypothetical protein
LKIDHMAAKRNQKSLTAKKTKSAGARSGAGRKARKSTASKGAAPKKSVSRRKARRSAAEVAKLKKAVESGLKKGTSAADLAKNFGVSTPYIYMLKTAA